MTTQDSDSVKAIKALDDVEKHLQDVTASVQRGSTWAWQHDGVNYLDVFGFGAMTDRAGKAIEEAAPLFEVYLHALGRVPPRFKAVFEQAAALMDWIGSLEYQQGAYHLARGLQKLQRVESGLQGLCAQPVEAAAHQKTKPMSKESKAAARPGATVKDFMLIDSDDEKERLLKTLHTLIDRERGKGSALAVLVCMELGLITKPAFSAMLAEFPGIGSKQGFDRYFNKGYSAYRLQEIDGIRAHLVEFQSSI